MPVPSEVAGPYPTSGPLGKVSFRSVIVSKSGFSPLKGKSYLYSLGPTSISGMESAGLSLSLIRLNIGRLSKT